MEDQILAILLDMQKNMKSMDGRFAELQQDVSGLKAGQESLQKDVSGLKSDVSGLKVGQESLQEQVTKTNITLENEIGLKLTAFFDGRQLDMDKIDHISETVDAMNDAYAATDIVTRVNSAEINKLKAKIG